MRGQGSGRWYRFSTKETTDSQRAIDIYWLRQEGMLTPGRVASVTWRRGERVTGTISIRVEKERLTLDYRFRYAGGEWQDVTEPVNLTWTPCHYGGRRLWFVCPRCGRRVGKLYGATRLFLCRQCCDLVYESQREDPADRMLRKARNIRRRLGGSDNMFDLFPEKPKGMHFHTYYRLMQQAINLERKGWGAATKRFGISV